MRNPVDVGTIAGAGHVLSARRQEVSERAGADQREGAPRSDGLVVVRGDAAAGRALRGRATRSGGLRDGLHRDADFALRAHVDLGAPARQHAAIVAARDRRERVEALFQAADRGRCGVVFAEGHARRCAVEGNARRQDRLDGLAVPLGERADLVPGGLVGDALGDVELEGDLRAPLARERYGQRERHPERRSSTRGRPSATIAGRHVTRVPRPRHGHRLPRISTDWPALIVTERVSFLPPADRETVWFPAGTSLP
jgi:hypothetical protein